jgi:hypothetical protein
MQSNILAQLVAEAIRAKGKVSLEERKTADFHREFELEISEELEELRSAKRRAYEEAKNIAVR